MARPEAVILDTSALYALISATDQFHDEAVSAFEALVDSEQRMIVTSYVLAETAALVHRRLGFNELKSLWESLPLFAETMWIEAAIHNAAWRELAAAEGRGPGFVDWTTILAARRLGSQIFAFDGDFARQNVAVIP